MKRTVLGDADGPIGSYDRSERDGNVYADLFERASGVLPERAARAVLDQLAAGGSPPTRRSGASWSPPAAGRCATAT